VHAERHLGLYPSCHVATVGTSLFSVSISCALAVAGSGALPQAGNGRRYL